MAHHQCASGQEKLGVLPSIYLVEEPNIEESDKGENMVYLCIAVGIFLFVASRKINVVARPAPRYRLFFTKKRWLTRVCAVLIMIGGIGIEASQIETPPEQAVQQSQAKVQQPAPPIQPKTQTPAPVNAQPKPEPARVSQSKYTSMKSLGLLDVAEPVFLNMLNEANLKIGLKHSPLDDGTPRIMYETDTCYVEAIGKPEVKQVSIMFVPTKDISQNSSVLLMLGATMKAYCRGSSEQNSRFVRSCTDFMGGTATTKSVSVGQCNTDLFKGSKEFPLYVMTFSAR